MAVPIAELFISVSADVNGAISGLNSLQTKLTGTTNAFSQARPAALALTAVAAGIGAAFLGSVKEAANFEQAMANVRAVMSPAEAKQFGSALDDLALSLGEKTSFNAMQVAAGLQEMLKAGFSAEDVLGGAAEAVLNLAAATDTGVAQAGTLAAQSMSAFGLSVKDLPGIVDTLAGVSVTTAADMDDMRQALSDAGVTAASTGLSFAEFATSIGIFRQAGVSANASGTALKTMLTRLVPNTKAEVSAFNNLGLTVGGANNVFFDAQGHFRGMANASGQLKRALGGMSDEQRNATIAVAFGTEAIQGVNALVDQGADGFNKYAQAIGQISATELAAARINTLFGALDQLGGKLQSVSIRIGKLFAPEIRVLVDTVTGLVKAFGELTPAQQRTVAVFGLIAGAIAGAVGGFVLLAPAIAQAGPAFVALGKVLAAVSLPLKILAAVGAALFAAWRTDFGGIRTLVENAFGSLPDLLGHIGDIAKQALTGDFGGAFDTFRAVVRALSPELGDFVDNVLPTLTSAAAGVKSFWDNQLSPALGRLGDFLKDEVAPRVRDFVASVFPKLQEGAAKVKDFWDNELSPALGRLAAFLKDEVGPRVREFADNVLPTLQRGAAGVKDFWDNELSPALSRMGVFLETEVTPKVKAFVDNVLPTLQTGAEKVKSFWDSELAPALGRIGVFLETEVTPKIKAFVDQAMPTLNDGAQKVKDFWDSQLLPTLRNPGPILDSLATSFETAVGRIGTAAESGKLGVGAQALAIFFANFDTIKGQVASLKPLGDAIKNFSGALLGLNEAIDLLIGRSVVELFGSLGTSIQQFSDAIGPTTPTIAAIGAGLSKIGDFLQPATDFFTKLTVAIDGFTAAVNAAPNIQALLTPSGGLAPGQQGPVATPQGGIDPLAALATGARGALGAAVPLISIGSLIISSEAEANAFIQRMADAIRGSSGRVNAPPDNSGNPQLSVVTP